MGAAEIQSLLPDTHGVFLLIAKVDCLKKIEILLKYICGRIVETMFLIIHFLRMIFLFLVVKGKERRCFHFNVATLETGTKRSSVPIQFMSPDVK